MTSAPEVVFSVCADGRPVAEAEVADPDGARALLAAAREAGARLAWAYSSADLAAAGFGARPGYRRMAGPVAGPSGAGPEDVGQDGDGVSVLPAGADSAGLWALAFRGQWGHKTPQEWPLDLPAGTITLCLRRDGEVAGLCRVEPEAGLVDAPGLVPAHRDLTGYQALLEAALALVRAPTATLESWGDEPERVRAAERLGLRTAEYVQGWECDLPA